MNILTLDWAGDGFFKAEPMPDGFADVVVYRKDAGEPVDVVAFPTLMGARARIDRVETLLDAESPEASAMSWASIPTRSTDLAKTVTVGRRRSSGFRPSTRIGAAGTRVACRIEDADRNAPAYIEAGCGSVTFSADDPTRWSPPPRTKADAARA